MTIELRDPENKIAVFQAGFRSIFITIPYKHTGKTLDANGNELMTFELTERQGQSLFSMLETILIKGIRVEVVNEQST